jgi:hypothetical protein
MPRGRCSPMKQEPNTIWGCPEWVSFGQRVVDLQDMPIWHRLEFPAAAVDLKKRGCDDCNGAGSRVGNSRLTG